MITLLNILSFIIVWTYAAFPFLLLKSFLPLRKSIFVQIIAYISLGSISVLVFFPNDYGNLLLGSVGFLLHVLIFHSGRMIEKISAIFILFPTIISLNYLTEDIGRLIYNTLPGSELMSTSIHTISLFVRFVIWFLIWWFFKNKISSTYKILTTPMWIMIDGVCLSSFVGVISVISLVPQKTFLSYPTCIACLIASHGCIYLVSYISKSMRESFEIQNLKLQQAYYEELEKNQLTIRKLNHDMNNHLSIINTFLVNGDKEKAKSYFDNLSHKFHTDNRVFCKNKIVNAILNAKYNLAIEHNVDTFFNIDLDYLIGIDDISICSIFANTLDNAIEACSSISDSSKRKLSVKSRYDKEHFLYEVTNSKENEINKSKGKFKTSKSNASGHGFGLQNVEDIVTAYHGTMDISYTSDTFTIIILIHV